MTKRTLCLCSLLCACALLHAAPLKIRPNAHGHSTNAKIAWKALPEMQALCISFQPNTPYNSSGWYTHFLPLMKPGEKLRLTAKFKAEGVTDPQATASLGVQGADRKGYLGTKAYNTRVRVAEVGDKEGSIELVFTMPNPEKAFKWTKATQLLITVSARSANGTFTFWDINAEYVK